jgi:hypothetical protein
MNMLAGIFTALACGTCLIASTICVDVKDQGDYPTDADVSVVNLETNKLSVARSGPTGRACLSDLPEGRYSVEVSREGFVNVKYYPILLQFKRPQELKYRLMIVPHVDLFVGSEADVHGTLKQGGLPVGSASICAFGPQGGQPVKCTDTSEIGEYAFSLPPGNYRMEIRTSGGAVTQAAIDLSVPGDYWNRIIMPEKAKAERGSKKTKPDGTR